MELTVKELEVKYLHNSLLGHMKHTEFVAPTSDQDHFFWALDKLPGKESFHELYFKHEAAVAFCYLNKIQVLFGSVTLQ